MNNEAITDAAYINDLKTKAQELMEELYVFEETPQNGVKECRRLSELIFDLGQLSEFLRAKTNNTIPLHYNFIDDLIENVDVEKLPQLFCLALVRYTFIAKDGLNNWVSLKDRVAIKLEKNGENSKRLLRGL